MKKLSAVVSFAVLLMLSGCKKIVGEGDLRTETRSTAGYTGLDAQITGHVFYVQGSDHKVELTAQQNILNVLETPIINNKLIVRFKRDVNVKTHDVITVRVTAPSLTSIGLSGSGSLSVQSPLVNNTLALHLSGSGSMFLTAITTTQLECAMSGSGKISIAGGTANTASYKISGSGNIQAQSVLAKSVSATTSGSGSITLWASESLDAVISGSGSIFYTGNPAVSTKISGSGQVKHL